MYGGLRARYEFVRTDFKVTATATHRLVPLHSRHSCHPNASVVRSGRLGRAAPRRQSQLRNSKTMAEVRGQRRTMRVADAAQPARIAQLKTLADREIRRFSVRRRWPIAMPSRLHDGRWLTLPTTEPVNAKRISNTPRRHPIILVCICTLGVRRTRRPTHGIRMRSGQLEAWRKCRVDGNAFPATDQSLRE